MEDQEIKYQISPKFNLLYEMGMPTGRKIIFDMFALIAFIILTIITVVKGGSLEVANYSIINNLKVEKFLVILCIIADIVTIIKLIADIVFQNLQYNHITYTFYDKMMVYEDDFLNQHRKNIEYKNIKEIEIRRTIWDRLLNYGIIIINTNADNERNNGLVIYSIKDPKQHYNIINELIHKRDQNLEIKTEDNVVKDDNLKKEEFKSHDEEQTEEDFKNSLKNINKE